MEVAKVYTFVVPAYGLESSPGDNGLLDRRTEELQIVGARRHCSGSDGAQHTECSTSRGGLIRFWESHAARR